MPLQSDLVVQQLQAETLIYNLKTNKAFCLNETSTLIWQLCDGKRTVAEISRSLSKKLNKPISEDLIWLALDQFKSDNLLENKNVQIEFSGLSRRKMIHKVGLATMAVLPLVIGVTPPKASMAASGGPIALFGACPSGSGCAAGLTCRNCFGCTPNVQVSSCCAIVGGGRGPGLDPSVTCASDSDLCSGFASNSCCSGTANFTLGACGTSNTSGTCICN